MSLRLTQLLEAITPQERAEVEAFAAFVIVRRHLQHPQLLADDISVQELTELVATSGSFGWLSAEEGVSIRLRMARQRNGPVHSEMWECRVDPPSTAAVDPLIAKIAIPLSVMLRCATIMVDATSKPR